MENNISMLGKTAVVTGATAGIGLSSVIALARAGAGVIGVGRDPARCRQAQEQVQSACPSARVTYLVADLSFQSQVRQLAGEIKSWLIQQDSPHLDALVNNAGTYVGKLTYTAEGFERTLAVNHLAPFLLTYELLPVLTDRPGGRVLTVSSGSHHGVWLHINRLNKPLFYFGFFSYQATKLANILFSLELNRRLLPLGGRAFAIDPGLVNTGIGGKESLGLEGQVWNNHRQRGETPEKPAENILYLAGVEPLPTDPAILWKDCHPLQPSRQAIRKDLARLLWDQSCRWCGISCV
jgi:NAD(P)-dependent dehydrogenase (short-subunit alcohol dehydrogenase family)